MMWPMATLLVTLSSVIFIVVTYLMVKVTIDRAARPIALMKVFGYRRGELRRLYLDGNLVVVAAGLLALVPLCKLLIDLAYPYLVANVGGGLDVTWPPSWYAVAYVGALVCYLVVEVLLMRRVNRMAPTEALQTREWQEGGWQGGRMPSRGHAALSRHRGRPREGAETSVSRERPAPLGHGGVD